MTSGVNTRFLSAFAAYSGSAASAASSSDEIDVVASLRESYANAQKSNPAAWTQISAPQKNTPGSSATVPLANQRALRRDVGEPSTAAVQKETPFDAGRISANSGRIAILGQVGANDAQDVYKVTLMTDGKLNLYAPNPDYDSTKTGSKISVGDAKIEVFDAAGKVVATTDTADAAGFSNWVSLSTEGLGGLQAARGEYTVKVSRDSGVASATPVNYTLYAVMGDPGATTFYTVKKTPLTPDQQKTQAETAAVAAAKSAAASSSSSSILSLFA